MVFFYDDERQIYNQMNSTNLEYIKIFNLFGENNIFIKFDDDVNIYIGENGLGKTTILNCIYNILKKRYRELIKIDFQSFEIKFRKHDKILITMTDLKKYCSGKNNRRFTYFDENEIAQYIDYLTESYSKSVIDSNIFEMIVHKVSRNFELPSMYVRRFVQEYFENGFTLSDKNYKKGNVEKVHTLTQWIDECITENILYLTTYRRIEDDFSSMLENGRTQTNESLIKFGMSDVQNTIDDLLKRIQTNSIDAFNQMTSLLIKQYTNTSLISNKGNCNIDAESIKIVFDRLGDSIAKNNKEQIIKLLNNGKIYEEKYFYLLNLLNNLLESYDKQKILDEKIKKFVDCCNKYFRGKHFAYDQGNLKLQIVLDNHSENFKRNSISLTNLSSGEKQIVSLFSKLYLEDDNNYILIIDEPELSLSIDWQRMLLPDIMRSESCKLLLTVTHSPFIFENEFDEVAKEMKMLIED